MPIDTLVVGELETNCYFLVSEKNRDTVVIDPGAEPEKIIRLIKNKRYNVVGIINTHGHADHISGNSALRDYPDTPPKIQIHKNDADMLVDSAKNLSAGVYGRGIVSYKADILLAEGDLIRCSDDESLTVLHTPGHTRGGICLLSSKGYLFSGDTLFFESAGRTDLPGGDDGQLSSSLKRLMGLNGELTVYAGHGRPTTINHELKHNPYI